MKLLALGLVAVLVAGCGEGVKEKVGTVVGAGPGGLACRQPDGTWKLS